MIRKIIIWVGMKNAMLIFAPFIQVDSSDMKISLNWLKDYIDLEAFAPTQIAEILTDIGLEVEGMETVESVKGGLEGIVVGLVTKCEKHPNADRLSLTEVDLGESSPRQIVCGAPNVAAGQKVLVATVGTILYDQEGSPFKIKKGKIRGEVSEGMICAEDELGLGNDHSGIMVLPDDLSVGTLAKDHFELDSDIIFDIALTPNRSDATCHLGVAKDLKAALQINYGQKDATVKLPTLAEWKVIEDKKDVEVTVENSEACPRYAGVSITGIKVASSPKWLQDRLMSIGVRPINNVVDTTNYVLHELGQPLHAFDLDKIDQKSILVKTLPQGTSFVTLDEKERKLSAQDLMICDGSSRGLCIAGVFGGIGSGVTEATTSIFLEAAHFNAKWIRRSSERHLLFTDAAKVFEKGSDPNVCVAALKRAVLMICDLAGGEITSEVIDVYPAEIGKNEISLSYERLNTLIGVEIPKEKVHAILEALEIEIVSRNENGLVASIPTNKADVTRQADLIEEVLRIYGFNNVPLPAGMALKINPSEKLDPLALQNRVADYLVAQGYNEMMALSMLDKKYYEPSPALIRINNTSNLNMEVMRPDMLSSSLEAVRHNVNRQQTHLRLFEFGFTYGYDEASSKEEHALALTFCGGRVDHWLASEVKSDHEYYLLKSVVEGVLKLLGFDRYRAMETEHNGLAWGMRYQQKKITLVDFGKVKKDRSQNFEVKGDVFYARFYWDQILGLMDNEQVQVTEISKFPSVRRDLALVMPLNVTYAALEKVVRQLGQPLINDVHLFDVYIDKSLGEGMKSYALAITFSSATKTLSDKEIDMQVEKILHKLAAEFDARLR